MHLATLSIIVTVTLAVRPSVALYPTGAEMLAYMTKHLQDYNIRLLQLTDTDIKTAVDALHKQLSKEVQNNRQRYSPDEMNVIAGYIFDKYHQLAQNKFDPEFGAAMMSKYSIGWLPTHTEIVAMAPDTKVKKLTKPITEVVNYVLSHSLVMNGQANKNQMPQKLVDEIEAQFGRTMVEPLQNAFRTAETQAATINKIRNYLVAKLNVNPEDLAKIHPELGKAKHWSVDNTYLGGKPQEKGQNNWDAVVMNEVSVPTFPN